MSLFSRTNVTIFITCISIYLACSNDLHCIMCLGQKCVMCAHTFPSPDTNCCQLPPVPQPNCYIYSSSTECATCQPGFYLSSNSACLPIQGALASKCILGGQDDLTCVVCDSGVLESEGNCGSNTGCSDPNCQLCYHDSNGTEQCYLCANGFFALIGPHFDQHFCVAISHATNNCDKSTSSNFCLICKAGFYYQNGLCLSSDYTSMNLMRPVVRAWILFIAFLGIL